MENFPPNSQRSKAEAGDKIKSEPKTDEVKKVTKVVEGDVVRQKKPITRRLKDTFVGGDAKAVWGFVVMDVLVPAGKDMIADAFSQGVERMIYGEARSVSRRTGARPGGPSGYVSYDRYSRGPVGSYRREEPREVSRRARASHDFDEIVLATRVEAETVIDRLFDLVSRYETATVADLYELVGVSGSYTDDKWGWTDIRGAGVDRVRNGYLLNLPKPSPLD